MRPLYLTSWSLSAFFERCWEYSSPAQVRTVVTAMYLTPYVLLIPREDISEVRRSLLMKGSTISPARRFEESRAAPSSVRSLLGHSRFSGPSRLLAIVSVTALNLQQAGVRGWSQNVQRQPRPWTLGVL